MNRRRTRRSRVVEIILVVVAVLFVFAFLDLGWYEAIGHWRAEQFTH